MSCPSCRCHKCRSYNHNPAPWGTSAWASHMDAPPVANEGPATSLETSMTEHFLGPMRNPLGDKGFETTDAKIQRLYREYTVEPTLDNYNRLIRAIDRTGMSIAHFFRDKYPEPPRDNPWDPLEAKIKKLCLYSDLSAAEISEHMDIPLSWAVEACRTHRQDYRIRRGYGDY